MPRKPGVPAGRAEGRVTHVIMKKPTPKKTAGSGGPKSKFGFQGGGATPSSRVTAGSGAGRDRDSSSFEAYSDRKKGRASKSRERPAKPDHWHKDDEGNISRGPASAEDDLKSDDHIEQLGPDNMKLGMIIDYEMANGQKGDGKLVAWGENGVTVVDAEGEQQNVYYDEIDEVYKKPVAKKDPGKTHVDGGSIRTAVHALKNWWKSEKTKKDKKKKK